MRRLALIAVVLLAGCSTSSPATPTATATPIPPASSPAASPSAAATSTPTATPTPSPSPSPSPSPLAALPRNSVAKVVAANLPVRDKPNPATEAFDAYAAGDLVYIVDGPRNVSGHPWYDLARLSIDHASGWVEADQPDGSAALAPGSLPCAPLPTTYEQVVAIAQFEIPTGLICYGDKPIALDARLAAHEATCGVSPGWTTVPAWLGPCEPHDYITALTGTSMDSSFDAVLPPGVSTTKLHYGTDPKDWLKVHVVGQFDYPAARTCKGVKLDGTPPTKAEVILGCRAQFVITSIKPA